MLIRGDARNVPLLDATVDCIISSPPYFGGIRDYGHAAQIGLEREPAEYVAALVTAGRELRRPLKPDGSFWLNLGDVYAASGKGGGGSRGASTKAWASIRDRKGFRMPPVGFKFKDMTMAPFLVADALRRDGWYLRSTIIWSKPVATEPPRLDRPSTSHEYLFLLTKSEDSRVRGKEKWWYSTVWTIAPESSVDHQATMPVELVRRCLVSATQRGDMVCDTFIGSGTVGAVAERLGRRWVGVDLSYQSLAKTRTAQRGLRFDSEATGDGRATGEMFAIDPIGQRRGRKMRRAPDSSSLESLTVGRPVPPPPPEEDVVGASVELMKRLIAEEEAARNSS